MASPNRPLVDLSRWETSVPGEVSTREYRNSDGTFTVQSDYILVPSRETHKETLTCVTSYNEEVFTDSVTLDIQCESAEAKCQKNRIKEKSKAAQALIQFVFSVWCSCFLTRRTRSYSGRVWWKLVHQPRERPAELPSGRQPERLAVSVETVSATASRLPMQANVNTWLDSLQAMTPSVLSHTLCRVNGSLPSNVEIRDNVLIFKGPLTYDVQGTYMCDATNSIGTRSASVEVSILGRSAWRRRETQESIQQPCCQIDYRRGLEPQEEQKVFE